MGSLKSADIQVNPSVINVWNTVADITGAGYIQLVGLFNGSALTWNMHMKLEIDGDVPIDIDLRLTASYWNEDYGGAQYMNVKMPLYLRFDVGFKLTYMDDVGGANTAGGVLYTIDQ